MVQKYQKSIFTIIIGDIFIWYDFTVFGYLAPIIGQMFFPTSNPHIALAKAFLLFAAGFLLRPIGGIILGNIGDKYGRKIVLVISFLAMSIPSALIGMLPTYARIGWYSTLALIILRIIQGLSAGGELSGAASYTYEIVPPKQRGFWCSWNSTASVLGVFGGSLVVMILSHLFSHQQLVDFGWRLAFLLGAALIVPSIIAIKFLPESARFQASARKKEIEKIPILGAFKTNSRSMLAILLINALQTVSLYVMVMWLPSFATVFLGKSLPAALTINTISMFTLIAIMPFAGYLSDKIGYVKLAMYSLCAQFILFLPLFYLIIHGGQVALLIAQLIFVFAFCGMAATTSTILVLVFPAKTRCSGAAISYNLAVSIFGGTAPLVCTFLINITKINIIPAFYLMFCALLAIPGYILVKRIASKIDDCVAESSTNRRDA